jgi:hypothetical protein
MASTRALLSIVEHPLRYLQSLGIFAYRGIWFMRPSGPLKLVSPMTFYVLGALMARNKILIAAFGLGAGSFLFHSALTHAITRYNAPLTPLVFISVLWLCIVVGGFLKRPREQGATVAVSNG